VVEDDIIDPEANLVFNEFTLTAAIKLANDYNYDINVNPNQL